MATSAQQLQEKAFLQKLDIRTMKKDLKKLREFDSLKEREKIRNINPAVAPQKIVVPPPKPPIIISKPVVTVPVPEKPIEKAVEQGTSLKADQVLEEISKREVIKEHSTQLEIKEYANEEEKQQIFLLQKRKSDLEANMQGHNGTDESSLILEKNNILLEQKEWENKLAGIIQEEEKNEAEQKVIEQKELDNKVPAQRQVLEKERWAMEDKLHEIEKKRWVAEEKLAKLAESIQNLDTNYQEYNTKENNLRQEIISIDNSLRAIYSTIAQRENIKKEEIQKAFVSKRANDAIGKVQQQHQRIVESNQVQQKEYFQNIPQAAKEKLAKSTAIEETQRRKFIEDVEKWAKEEKQQDNTSN